jgi:hypothetical protein
MKKQKKLMTKTINGRIFKVYRSNGTTEGVFFIREFSRDALTGKRKLECTFYCNDFNLIK